MLVSRFQLKFKARSGPASSLVHAAVCPDFLPASLESAGRYEAFSRSRDIALVFLMTNELDFDTIVYGACTIENQVRLENM